MMAMRGDFLELLLIGAAEFRVFHVRIIPNYMLFVLGFMQFHPIDPYVYCTSDSHEELQN